MFFFYFYVNSFFLFFLFNSLKKMGLTKVPFGKYFFFVFSRPERQMLVRLGDFGWVVRVPPH